MSEDLNPKATFSFEEPHHPAPPNLQSTREKFAARSKNLRVRPKSQYKIEPDHLNVIDIKRKIQDTKMSKDNTPEYFEMLHELHATHLQLREYLAGRKEDFKEKYKFQPKVNQKSQKLSQKMGSNVLERNQNWIERRKEKLEKLAVELNTADELRLREAMRRPLPPTHIYNQNVVPKVLDYIYANKKRNSYHHIVEDTHNQFIHPQDRETYQEQYAQYNRDNAQPQHSGGTRGNVHKQGPGKEHIVKSELVKSGNSKNLRSYWEN